MKQFNLLIVALLIGSISVFSQEINVSGIVTDDGGNAIPGVNVAIVGTTQGALTDFDGKYSISTETGSKLLFSYVGMKTLIKLVDSKVLDIILFDDILGLDEVIITGTSGVTKRKQLGAAITSISSKNLSKSKANVSIGEVLQGQVAGIKVNRNSGDPSGGISISLRGNSSLVGSSDPLYIVDGVIINNNSSSLLSLGGNTQNRLVDINPNDIERMEVLNGAAAAAIYGSRASNGVVQIFTKRGKKGTPRITYNSSVNFNSIRETMPYNDSKLQWINVGTEEDPVWETEEATRFNYQDYIFDETMGYENSLSINGGADKTGYSFSISQYKNEGIVRNTDFNRKSVKLRLDQEIYDWMDVSVGTYYSNSLSNDMPNGTNYGPLTSLLFLDNINDPNPDQNGDYTSFGGWLANPNEAVDRIEATQEYYRSINDFQVKIRPFQGATLNYVFGVDSSNGEGLLYIPYGFSNRADGVTEKSTIKTLLYNNDLNFSYQFDITDDLKSTTGLGYSYQYDQNKIFSVKNNQAIPLDGVIVTDPVNANDGGDYRTERSIWGGFLQQSFGYKNQLFLTLAGRIDGASVFGKEDRQQFYPKVSASYSISDASFWDSLRTIIGSLKLRTAWGQAGSLNALPPYRIYTNYSTSNYGGNVGFFPETVQGNSNLIPERQTELELGFDMSMLNDRVGITFSYYEQSIENLLIKRDLSPSAGFINRYDNIGSMTNKGVELAINAKPIKGEVTWGITGVFSNNKNNLTHVEGGKVSLGFWGSSVAITDHPIGVFYGTFFARDEKGELVLDDAKQVLRAKGHYEDRVLSDGETYKVAVQDFDPVTGLPTGTTLKKVIGDPNPDFVASLTNTLNYKNIGFRVQLDMSHGNDALSWDKRMGYLFQGGAPIADELNNNATIDRYHNKENFYIYESFLEDASYIKLREIALTYDLEVNQKYFKSILFSASGTNLISWDNHWGFDPETNTGGQQNGVMGQQMATVPIPRVFKLGAKFNF
ncbi:MAG TPA: SusC/RagA family TonB-linked outer membrane protein [Lutibacter sp.]|nr:SusC/RagA family TonB-linked outer membrane protein [Lutibacter sp.]